MLGPTELVLCSGTLGRDTSFVDRVGAARAGGFDAISLWGRDYVGAGHDGLSDTDLRLLLEDNGLVVAELDPVWRWLPGTADITIPSAHDPDLIFQFSETDMYGLAEQLGARSLNAVDIFGGDWTLDDATEAFAALCERAAGHGLRVHLEFLPWSKIPNLETAWRIVREAGRPNGGIMIDAWHYFRSGPDPELLRTIPGQHLTGVQLSDAPMRAEANLMQATLHERLLPGEGELPLAELVAGLHEAGAIAPFGVEVFSDTLHRSSPIAVGRRAGDALRRVVAPT